MFGEFRKCRLGENNSIMNAMLLLQKDLGYGVISRLAVLFSVLLFVIFMSGALQAENEQPQTAEEQAGRVSGRRIEVVVHEPEGLDTLCRTQIRVTYRVTNTIDQPISTQQHFPVFTTLWPQAKKKNFHVRVNDKPTEVKVENVLFAPQAKDEAGIWTFAGSIPGPTKEQKNHWLYMLEQWTMRDPELGKLMAEYKQLSSLRETLNQLTREFEEEVTKHLIHDDVVHAARYIASGDGAVHNLVQLIPEVDSSLRYDIDYQRWKYVSYLSPFDSESYQPYQQQWQRQAAIWFNSKPKLAELTPKLQAAWESHRQAQTLLSEIIKLLHDQCGLSYEDALMMRNFYLSPAYFHPGVVDILKKLFPAVQRERDEFFNKVTRNMTHWGFDGKLQSPITGNLYPSTAQHKPLRFFRDDPTIDARQTSKGF